MQFKLQVSLPGLCFRSRQRLHGTKRRLPAGGNSLQGFERLFTWADGVGSRDGANLCQVSLPDRCNLGSVALGVPATQTPLRLSESRAAITCCPSDIYVHYRSTFEAYCMKTILNRAFSCSHEEVKMLYYTHTHTYKYILSRKHFLSVSTKIFSRFSALIMIIINVS